MIYAQRPNAVGCTSFEKWKEMNHYVKRGTEGIALIQTVDSRKKLRYVYDNKDTGAVFKNFNHSSGEEETFCTVSSNISSAVGNFIAIHYSSFTVSEPVLVF